MTLYNFQFLQLFKINVLSLTLPQLRVVRAVAVIGGLLQIFFFMCLGGIIASVCQGAFLCRVCAK